MRPGPDHYTRLDPEPIDVIMAWGLDFPLGSVVKYVARWDAKGGIDDLIKARHFLDIYIEKKLGKKVGGGDADDGKSGR